MNSKYQNLQVGQRVYYTGDMANQPAWCTISKRDDNPRWGLSYNLLGDGIEAREFFGIFPSQFGTRAGKRFVIKEEHDAQQAAKMDRVRAQMAAVHSAYRTA